MRVVRGTFNGTGATAFLELGGIPDRLTITALGTSGEGILRWSKMNRVAASAGGIISFGGSTANTLLTAVQGIVPYEGGELLTSALQTSVTNGEGVYLRRDDKNYREASNATLNPGDGSGARIDTWTLNTAANRTGQFNADVVGTYIGVGSRILIAKGENLGTVNEFWANIEVLTAGQGITADEVTLSRAIGSGFVRYISNKWDWAPSPLGRTTEQGVKVLVTSGINANDAMQSFVAEFDE